MHLAQTNKQWQPLSSPFDYRHESFIVSVGFDLMYLRNAIVMHDSCFEMFIEDFVNTFKHRATASQEYFIFKNEVLYGNYLVIQPSGVNVETLSTLMDTLHAVLQKHFTQERLYVSNRLDYFVQKHSNYGLLFAKT